MTDQKQEGPREVLVCHGCRWHLAEFEYNGCKHPDAEDREIDPNDTPDWCPVRAPAPGNRKEGAQ